MAALRRGAGRSAALALRAGLRDSRPEFFLFFRRLNFHDMFHLPEALVLFHRKPDIQQF
jgi:hypothetical protein